MQDTRSSADLTGRVHRWLFDAALPFWADRGVDPGGHGFVEHLELDGRRADVDFKRLRVQARQIYVFSHAATLGWNEGLPAVERAVDFVVRNARLDGGGWARKLDRTGKVIDAELDLYDQAFMIFALAWWYKVTNDESVRRLALETLDAIKTELALDGRPGYRPAASTTDELQQNPHMHLLEASVAWAEFAGDGRFAEEAGSLVTLLGDHFIVRDTGALVEFFNMDWTPRPGVRGRLVEPGHHFEWSWLLYHYERVTGATARGAARSLFAFAEAHGVDPQTGLTWDEILDDGSLHSGDSRSWPQTEALKAHLARAEFEGVESSPRVRQITENLLDRYLDWKPTGTWIDHLKADGSPRADKIPASTFYHVFLAFSELLRLGS